MDCLLRVIQGPQTGQTLRMEPGETLLGTAPRAQFRLAGEGMSFEHAVITRTADEYVLENLSALGTELNDTRVTGKVKLHLRDKIRLSPDTVLMFQAADSSAMNFLARRDVLIGFGAVVVVALGLFIVFNPFAETPKPVNHWPRTYAVLREWIAQDVAKGALPQESLHLLDDAWRRHCSGDYYGATELWLKQQLLWNDLDKKDKNHSISAADIKYPRAAEHFAQTTDEPDFRDEQTRAELKAAMVQLIRIGKAADGAKAAAARTGL